MRIYVLDVTVLTFILSRCSLNQRDNNFEISYTYICLCMCVCVCISTYTLLIYAYDLTLKNK